MLPSTQHVARQQVARSGNMNFIDGNKQLVAGQCVTGQHVALV